jgi:hypothetical protein
MKKKVSAAEFVAGRSYLPEPLRDFHDQKDLFKTVHGLVAKRRAEEKAQGQHYPYLDDVTWVAAHVYVIDFFLWFMARHGWTLQRSRQAVEFDDLDARLAEAEKARLNALFDTIQQDIAERKGQGNDAI